ncbi:hypothetical protein TNCV_2031061 [Trichonephila clavipes]|nr:hypothetical protein TNCV_2031061 [Trichonephila clavipes]
MEGRFSSRRISPASLPYTFKEKTRRLCLNAADHPLPVAGPRGRNFERFLCRCVSHIKLGCIVNRFCVFMKGVMSSGITLRLKVACDSTFYVMGRSS